MANTCEGLDGSLPRDLREEIRKFVLAGGASETDYLDKDASCVFHYLLGEPGACGVDDCCLSKSGKVKYEKDGVTPYAPKYKLADPLPPGSLGRRGPRGRKAVARRKPRRTAKPRRTRR